MTMAMTQATTVPTTRPQPTAIRVDNDGVAEYDGDDLACSMCLEEVVAGIPVHRLICRHVFHIECWHDYLVSEAQPDCPNCRGRGRVIARWRFLAPPVVVYRQAPARDEPAVAHALSRAPSFQSIASESDSSPFQFVGPWWPSNQQQVYHSATQLPGQISIIDDPGAWANLIGGKLAKLVAQAGASAGLIP